MASEPKGSGNQRQKRNTTIQGIVLEKSRRKPTIQGIVPEKEKKKLIHRNQSESIESEKRRKKHTGCVNCRRVFAGEERNNHRRRHRKRNKDLNHHRLQQEEENYLALICIKKKQRVFGDRRKQ